MPLRNPFFKHLSKDSFIIESDETNDYVWFENSRGRILFNASAKILINKLNKFYAEYSDKQIDSLEKLFNKQEQEAILEYNIKRISEYAEKKQVKQNKSDEAGYVYFIQTYPDTVKIGLTVNIKRRLKEFEKILMPYKPVLLHSIKTNNMPVCESFFHNKFSTKRLRGEWFELSEDDIEEMKMVKEKNFEVQS